MAKSSIFYVTLILASLLLVGLASAQDEQLCHWQMGKGEYKFKVESAEDVENHLAEHDLDGKPGDPFPDMEGYIFGPACEPVQACPCSFSAEFIKELFPSGVALELDPIFTPTGCDYGADTNFSFIVLSVSDLDTDVAITIAQSEGEDFTCAGGLNSEDSPRIKGGPFGVQTYNACFQAILKTATDLGFTCTEFTP